MMTTATHSWIGRVALTAMLAIGATAPPAALGTDDVVDLVVEPVAGAIPRTPEEYEQQMIEWARGLFEQADLFLPPVDIRFSDHPDDCGGNQGTLRTAADGARIIRICAHHDKPRVRDRWRRRALVHELAHLWEQTKLDDATRREFTAYRELDHWNDRSDDWARRATEHAAETITWGLIDFFWLFVALPDNSCSEMLEGFRILTERHPIHGLDINCPG